MSEDLVPATAEAALSARLHRWRASRARATAEAREGGAAHSRSVAEGEVGRTLLARCGRDDRDGGGGGGAAAQALAAVADALAKLRTLSASPWAHLG